jgi:phosphoketolase
MQTLTLPIEPTTYTLTQEQLRKIDVYWRAANYVAVGRLYLDNPLLREPLTLEHALNSATEKGIRSTQLGTRQSSFA